MVKDWVMENFDKIQHFLVMTVVSVLLGLVFGIGIALVSAVVVSVIKEIYDKEVKRKKIEQGDLRADFAGISMGMLLLFLIRLFGLFNLL